MLKSNDPRIDLCGISEGRSWNIMLNLLLNFLVKHNPFVGKLLTDCFRQFRYDYKKVKKSSLKPQTSILAKSKS